MSNTALVGICGNFRRYIERQEGVPLAQLFEGSRLPLRELGRCEQLEELTWKHAGEAHEVLSLYLLGVQAHVRSESVRHLELVCTCLQSWVQRYVEAEGSGLWMVPLLLQLTAVARKVANQVDQAKKSERAERPHQENNAYLKQLVALYRKFFNTLNKERAKRAGHVWICCELLRAYFKLQQVSQCSFTLTTVSQSMQKDGFSPTDLPKAICVTFYFFWGKYLVFEHNLQGADEKLTWAFNNCPEKAIANRRRILLYLVPCKLRLGVLPTQELLHKYDLDVFVDVVKAIKEGNVQLFNSKMQELSADLIKMGTYLLMMRLKFMVLRNLTKGIFLEVQGRLADKSDNLQSQDTSSQILKNYFCTVHRLACDISTMSSFAPPSKKARRSHSNGAAVDSDGEFFPGIKKIEYNPDAGAGDNLCFKHYNAQEVVMGKTMGEWCRFSVCFWHTFRGTGADPFGFPTISRHWDDGSSSLENAKRRLQAAFEFFEKLGVKYYTFHDRDIAPEGDNLKETNANLDELTDLALELQEKTGVKLLWATCNLFANPRYMNGAASNPDAHTFAHAAAQVKKGLEIGKKLGAENFVFWGGREGYHTLLNTDVRRELDHMGSFFQMVVDYKKEIGFTGQLLIEPKPKEPTKHQYDYDAQTVIAFLKTYGLEDDFKLNIEPNHTTLAGHAYEHDVVVASKFGFLGSIDSNTGSPDLGWDTDQFPMDIKNCTLVMKAVIEQGGLAPGGLNFDCKIRRESTDLEDMFIAHIGAMDSFARGLKNAAKLIEDGTLHSLVKERYSSFDKGIGAKIEKRTTSLGELEAYIKEHGEPKLTSGKQEKCEAILNFFV